MNRIERRGMVMVSLAFCCIAACESSLVVKQPSGEDGAVVASVPNGAASVSFVPITEATTAVSSIGEQERLVIRSGADWDAYWARFAAAVTPMPPAPVVDFGANAVVAVAMGGRPTGGFAISVREVLGNDDGIYIVVVESSPGPTCIVTQSTTAPAAAISVPADGRPIQFVEESEINDCG